MKALLAALALVAAMPAHAHARPALLAAAPASGVDGLVRLLVPEDAMVDLATRAFEHSIAHSAAADTTRLYAQYPGLKIEVAARLRPVLHKILKRELPALRKEIAAILGADMDAREIADATTFFTSPTGRKVYGAALKSMGDRPDRSEADARSAAMGAAMSNLAPEDYPALLKFGATSAAGKISTVNPKIGAASRAWADRLTTKNEAKVRKLARHTMDRFVARTKRGKK